jgi:hypothetical protein
MHFHSADDVVVRYEAMIGAMKALVGDFVLQFRSAIKGSKTGGHAVMRSMIDQSFRFDDLNMKHVSLNETTGINVEQVVAGSTILICCWCRGASGPLICVCVCM